MAAAAYRFRLAVVAKHLLEREGLVRLLASSPRFDVVAVASSAAELAAAIDGDTPDVVVVVWRSPGSNGSDGSRELPDLDADAVLIVLARRPDARLAATLLEQGWGGRGYVVDQDQDRGQLLDSIREVASGETVLRAHFIVDDEVGFRQRLTPRELEVLAAIADGLSNGSIARSLQITMRGVERHVGSIYRKLDLRNGDGVDRRVAAALIFRRLTPER
jgi:DNA-binding NarL/FixJ family response regulator